MAILYAAAATDMGKAERYSSPLGGDVGCVFPFSAGLLGACLPARQYRPH